MRFWPDFARAVDVFLVVVALHGLRGNSLSGLLVGLLVGLLAGFPDQRALRPVRFR